MAMQTTEHCSVGSSGGQTSTEVRGLGPFVIVIIQDSRTNGLDYGLPSLANVVYWHICSGPINSNVSGAVSLFILLHGYGNVVYWHIFSGPINSNVSGVVSPFILLHGHGSSGAFCISQCPTIMVGLPQTSLVGS